VTTAEALSADQRAVLLAVQDGLPIVKRPYAAVGARLDLDEDQVIAVLEELLRSNKIKRIGAIPNHYALGITANGMSVWDVPDEDAARVGRLLAARAEVSHCYKRPRAAGWPYNLFAMVHGRDRNSVVETVERIGRDVGILDRRHEILFSTRLLKKRGTRLKSD
jgi:DNA-binding Lrp family transcriptional regulator